MSSISYYYEPSNTVVDGLGVFESTRFIDVPTDQTHGSGCDKQIFVGVLKDGAVLSNYVRTAFTSWGENGSSDPTHGVNTYSITFNKESKEWQLSMLLIGRT